MRLAVSNIAWTSDEDDDVHAALVEVGIDAIEIAPTRIWADPAQVPAAEAKLAATRFKDQGLEPVSFQSLLFARPDLTLFDDAGVRDQLLEYLNVIAELAGRVGARRMVFGSPRSRTVPAGMTPREAFDIATDFFRDAGDAAVAQGTMLCIEPNPPAYACNFVTTGADGIALVQAVDSPGFGLHLDAAGLVLAEGDPAAVARAAGSLIAHVHASAPQLGELEREAVDHDAFAASLEEVGYEGVVSIEMRSGPPGTNSERVRRAVALARGAYGR